MTTENTSNNTSWFDAALRYIDSWLETQVSMDRQTPGYSVAVSKNGKVVYSRAFGHANLEKNEALTPDHRFRVASHTKTFTATAIMQLMAAGKLSIYEPASKYLPFLQENPDNRIHEITIEEFLQHASGIIRDGKDAGFFGLERDFPSKDEIIELCKEKPLVLDSSAHFKYSNVGYSLLGMIIEAASGQSYAEYIENAILKPLKLSKTTAKYEQKNGPYVTGYTGLSPEGQRAPISSAMRTNGVVGAAGVCSTAEDLCRFYSAVMPGNNQLLPDRLKRQMLRQHWDTADGNALNRGYGAGFSQNGFSQNGFSQNGFSQNGFSKSFSISGYGLGFSCNNLDGHPLNGHSGGMPGQITQTFFDCDEGIVVSVLSNAHTGNVFGFQQGIWHILDAFKAAYDPASPLLKYSGKFHNIWWACHFVPLGNTIFLTNPTHLHPFKECAQIKHIKDHTFQVTKDQGLGTRDEHVQFVMDGDTATSVTYMGIPMMRQKAYEDYIQNLQKRAA